MRIIEIAPQENGAHRNQNGVSSCLDGWAIIPAEMEIPETYPFVDIEIDDSIPPTVTEMAAGTMPAPAPAPEPEPTQLDRMEAQVMYTALMTDTLLEEE